MSDTIRLSAVTLDCPDAHGPAGFYAAITGGTVSDRGPEWATGATRLAFQPNSGQCSVYADPAGHPFCPTTFDGVPG